MFVTFQRLATLDLKRIWKNIPSKVGSWWGHCCAQWLCAWANYATVLIVLLKDPRQTCWKISSFSSEQKLWWYCMPFYSTRWWCFSSLKTSLERRHLSSGVWVEQPISCSMAPSLAQLAYVAQHAVSEDHAFVPLRIHFKFLCHGMSLSARNYSFIEL